jgi:RNA polymerase sigma factor (TIGR02999 family)
MAAKMMRRVLVDHYRGRHAQKRGDGVARITMVDDIASAQPQSVDLLELDTALERLAALDAQQATIVELRFFAGLTVEETAAALGISTPTVKRHWALARAWLLLALSGDAPADGR